jgi:hypothetical protein
MFSILVTLFGSIYFVSMYIKADLPTDLKQRTNDSPSFTKNIHFLFPLRKSQVVRSTHMILVNIVEGCC